MSMAKTVLITGASSGIGYHLALEFAARGYNLALIARREFALQELKKNISERFTKCQVITYTLDITCYNEIAPVLNDMEKTLGRIDIVIAGAGIGGNIGHVGSGHFQTDISVIETNLIGAMATIDAAVSIFRRNERGQIVTVSSIAAYRGLPGAAAYSASKAAISVYTDSVRSELYGSPIKVTTLFPGYIDTPINQEITRLPFLISAPKGARIMADLIEKGVESATIPLYPWTVVKYLLRVLPNYLLNKII